MFVTHLIPDVSYRGAGVAESALRFALAIRDTDISQNVLALNSPVEEKDANRWSGIKIIGHKTIGPRSYSFAPKLLHSLLASNTDIVHVHGVWQYTCAATGLWSARTGKPYVVSPHGMLEPWIRKKRSPYKKRLVEALYQNQFLKNASAFHVVNDYEAGDIKDFIVNQPYRIIPNYVPEFVTDNEMPNWWKPAYKNRTIYLFLGRIHAKKGCDELREAWCQLSHKSPQFRDNSLLVFCGWNDGLNGFEERVAAANENLGNIIYAGPQFDLDKNRSLATACYFMLPSRSEGLPISVLEAWGAGIPAIITEECHLPSQSFATGAALRTYCDVKSIESSLERASQLSPDEWQKYSNAAKTLIKEAYSMVSVKHKIKEFYESAMSHNGNIEK